MCTSSCHSTQQFAFVNFRKSFLIHRLTCCPLCSKIGHLFYHFVLWSLSFDALKSSVRQSPGRRREKMEERAVQGYLEIVLLSLDIFVAKQM